MSACVLLCLQCAAALASSGVVALGLRWHVLFQARRSAVLGNTVRPHRDDHLLVSSPASPVAVLPAPRPEALIASPVGPGEDAKALLPVEDILAGVLPPAGPEVVARAVYPAVCPRTFVPTAVSADVEALSADGIALPCAAILRTVGPEVNAPTFLLAAFEGALETGPFRPDLHTVAILEVIAPLALVRRALTVVVHAIAMGHIGPPLADIDIAVGVGELALARSGVVVPLALIGGTVRPTLRAEAVPFATAPLAEVHRARLELMPRPVRLCATGCHPTQLGDLPVEVAHVIWVALDKSSPLQC
mmetsp:Transcript_113515/g.345320  ORF Transcript_113515/g.345320 Transcript_113515/m.345320 type:complete len:304 (-) Transcript_113515:218-1129(-)